MGDPVGGQSGVGVGLRVHTVVSAVAVPGHRHPAPHRLLKAVNPRWSSLLALPSNQRGQDLYAQLGYEYADPFRNTPDEPEFDLLLLCVPDTE
ncbi:hypothetical protein ABZZ80_08440 [Streptomyces sp. NPDC006356]